MKKVAVISGGRVSHGVFRSILDAMGKIGLDYVYVLVGTHFSKEHGDTWMEVDDDGYVYIALSELPHFIQRERFSADSIYLMDGIRSMEPDCILIQGDKPESLAGAITGTILNIPVFHTHGGEVSNGFDHVFRNAITSLAHVHFPHSVKASERLRKMGEEEFRVKDFGDPALDYIKNENFPDVEDILGKYNLGGEGYVLVLQNPWKDERINETLIGVRSVCMEFGLEAILIRPNSDPGYEKFNKVIGESKGFHVFPNIPYQDFLSLMNSCSCMIGNSSAAICEAPHLGTPVIDVGHRQDGRDVHAGIRHVPCDAGLIKDALMEIINDRPRLDPNLCPNWSDGKAGERIAKFIQDTEVSEKLLVKRSTI